MSERDSPPLGVTVRVEHACDSGCTVTLAGFADAGAAATELAGDGIACTVHGSRLTVDAPLEQLLAATARLADGARLAAVVDAAVAASSSPPPDTWTPAGALPTSRRTLVQAVLNVTPDSFSDGGLHYATDHPAAAIEAGEALLAEGADIIDVGGESARPGADPVAADEELRRVAPVVEGLASTGALVSVDTAKAAVARAAVDAGAVIVNDVSAGALDEELLPTVAELDVTYVLMHMQGTPRTMQVAPTYDDVVAEVFDHLARHLAWLETLGIGRERVVVDPGIGFGKTIEHNVELLRRLHEFTSLGRPVLVGASRKSFLGQLTGEPDPSRRLSSSVAAATVAVANGASIVRVHDVRETRDAVAVVDAVVGRADLAAGTDAPLSRVDSR